MSSRTRKPIDGGLIPVYSDQLPFDLDERIGLVDQGIDEPPLDDEVLEIFQPDHDDPESLELGLYAPTLEDEDLDD